MAPILNTTCMFSHTFLSMLIWVEFNFWFSLCGTWNFYYLACFLISSTFSFALRALISKKNKNESEWLMRERNKQILCLVWSWKSEKDMVKGWKCKRSWESELEKRKDRWILVLLINFTSTSSDFFFSSFSWQGKKKARKMRVGR